MSDLLPRGVTSVTVRFKRDQQGTNIKPSHEAKASQGNVGVCGRVRRKTDAQERELEAERCKQNRYTQTTFIDVDGEECVTKVRTDDHEDERADWNQHQHLDLLPPSSLRSSLCSRSLCPSSLRSSSRPSSLRPSSLRPSSAGTTASHHSPLRVMKSGLKPTSFEIRPRAKTAAPITPAPLVSLSSLHEYEERMREYGHARATIIPAVTRVRVNTQVKKSKKHYHIEPMYPVPRCGWFTSPGSTIEEKQSSSKHGFRQKHLPSVTTNNCKMNLKTTGHSDHEHVRSSHDLNDSSWQVDTIKVKNKRPVSCFYLSRKF